MKLYELVDAYKASRDFNQLAPASQVHYQQMIDAVYKTGYRAADVEAFSSSYVDAFYVKLIRAYGPSKALQITKVMKKIWNYGYRVEMIKRNPWSKMGIKAPKPRQVVWKYEEYQMACGIAVQVNRPMFAFLRLLHWTGQRPSDILSIDYANAFHDTDLVITQSKTGKTVVINFMRAPMLVADLKKMGRFPSEFKRNYHNQWAKIKSLAEGRLDHLQLRDLRRTVLTEMAQGGATDSQIRAVSGHSGHSPIPDTVYVVRDAAMATEGLKRRLNGGGCSEEVTEPDNDDDSC